MTTSDGWILACMLVGVGAVLFGFASRGGAETSAPLKSVTVKQGCGLTFRLPETWNQIAAPPEHDLTFAPPDAPHLRLMVSSLTAPIETEAGQDEAGIERLAAGLVKKLPVNDGSLDHEIRRLDTHRAVISYELHPDAIAPQYTWWLIERQGPALCASLFTLSVYADQFRSDETGRLVALLGREVAAATCGPAGSATVQAGAGGSAGESGAWQAVERLVLANHMASLSESNLPDLVDHVVAVARDFQSRASAPLKPVGTEAKALYCLVFSMAVHTTWLQGTRIGLHDPMSPNESALWRATLTRASRGSPDAEVFEANMLRFYADTREANLDLLARWLRASMDARVGKPDAGERLFLTLAAAVRGVGADTKLGRDAEGAAREPWMAAMDAMNDVMLGSAAGLESVLKQQPH